MLWLKSRWKEISISLKAILMPRRLYPAQIIIEDNSEFEK